MEQQWVDQFFATGKLRLSSFAKFKQHSDEQRLDSDEGEVSVLLQPPPNEEGHALYMRLQVAGSAYALSASLRNDDCVAEAFASKAYIKINHPTAFGIAPPSDFHK